MSKRKNKEFKNVINFDNLVQSKAGYFYDPKIHLSVKNFTKKNLNTETTSLKQRIINLTGGKTNPNIAPFNYSKGKKRKRPKNYHVNDQVPVKQNVKTPKGTKWQNITAHINHPVLDYENTDVYSDFDGWFNLEKTGNKYHCWVTLKDTHTINDQGKPTREITGYYKPIANAWWTDNTKNSSNSFALASIAAFLGKHNIYEDNPKNGGPMIYHDVNMGVRSVKYWNVFDGGNDISKPHIIAHKGENIIIDTGKMKVYKTDGTDLTKYTSFESSFPPLYGGQINNIDFYPTIGPGCDVDIAYVPRIR